MNFSYAKWSTHVEDVRTFRHVDPCHFNMPCLSLQSNVANAVWDAQKKKEREM